MSWRIALEAARVIPKLRHDAGPPAAGIRDPKLPLATAPAAQSREG
jgi:hypothetical protein